MYSSAVDPKPSIDRKCSLASSSSSAASFFRLRTVFVEAVFEVDYLIAQLGENRLVVLPLALPALRHLTVAPACGIQTPLAPPLEIGVLDVLHAVFPLLEVLLGLLVHLLVTRAKLLGLFLATLECLHQILV